MVISQISVWIARVYYYPKDSFSTQVWLGNLINPISFMGGQLYIKQFLIISPPGQYVSKSQELKVSASSRSRFQLIRMITTAEKQFPKISSSTAWMCLCLYGCLVVFVWLSKCSADSKNLHNQSIVLRMFLFPTVCVPRSRNGVISEDCNSFPELFLS